MAALAHELEVALTLARQAGDVVDRIQKGGELGVEMKPGDEPVTVADRIASEMIIAGLTQAFPHDPLISEEAVPAEGAFGSSRLWLIDPIDGTKDFIRGEDGYSVMIGLVVNSRPVLGVVHMPAQNRTFWGTPDGAWVQVGDQISTMTVSKIATAGEARLVASKSHRGSDIDRVKQALDIGEELNVASVGVKLCLIASGVRDLYVNPSAKTKVWDTCAPEAILDRAGGRLTDMFGTPINYTHELRHLRGLIASNGVVHDEVVGKLGPMFPNLRP